MLMLLLSIRKCILSRMLCRMHSDNSLLLKRNHRKKRIFHNNNPFNWDRAVVAMEYNRYVIWNWSSNEEIIFCFVVGFVVNQFERVTVAVKFFQSFPIVHRQLYRSKKIDSTKSHSFGNINFTYIYINHLSLIRSSRLCLAVVYTGKTTAASFFSLLLLYTLIFAGPQYWICHDIQRHEWHENNNIRPQTKGIEIVWCYTQSSSIQWEREMMSSFFYGLSLIRSSFVVWILCRCMRYSYYLDCCHAKISNEKWTMKWKKSESRNDNESKWCCLKRDPFTTIIYGIVFTIFYCLLVYTQNESPNIIRG